MPNPKSEARVDRFLAGMIPARDFDHAMHVEVAWALLNRYPFVEALARCTAAIKAMAERAGAADKFNLTITAAFMALIDEHRRAHPHADWTYFIAANPDLLDKKLLARWYTPERLRSAQARETFLMPAAPS